MYLRRSPASCYLRYSAATCFSILLVLRLGEVGVFEKVAEEGFGLEKDVRWFTSVMLVD